MRSYGSVAKSVRESKEKHPEQFCPDRRCLWRTGDGSPCPRHKANYPQATAEMDRKMKNLETFSKRVEE